MLEKIHIFISIIAAFAVAFFCLITKTPFMKSVVGLIVTIVVFYIIGIIVRNYFTKSISKEEDDENASTKEPAFEDVEAGEELIDTEDDIVAEGIDES